MSEVNNTVWPLVADGCALVQDTEKTLKSAVEWETDELGPDPNDGYFDTLPHTLGRLVKKR